MIELGSLYLDGRENVPVERLKGEALIRKAAERGNASAQIELGNRLLTGRVLNTDPTQAFSWYLKAAEKGDAKGQFSLAELYFDGVGTPQDYKKAASWYRKSAEQANEGAINRLANCYASGSGVQQDYKLAYAWASFGAAIDTYGYGGFASKRDEFAKKLSPAKLAEAQELAGDYFEKYKPAKL